MNKTKVLINNNTVVFPQRITTIYEVIISILALTAVVIAFCDITGKIPAAAIDIVSIIDTSILVIFTIDYFTRLILAREKKKFIKQNILDLIAIIPFNSLFRVFRIARLFRVVRFAKLIRFVRLFAFAKKFTSKVSVFINTNGFIYVLYLTVLTIAFGAAGIYLMEFNKTGNSFADAVWWSFVTTTTVGYGDISPSTIPGRIIASVLMIVGIGFVGMLTGTIATYFLSSKKAIKCEVSERKILDLSDLDTDEVNQVLNFVEFIRSKKK